MSKVSIITKYSAYNFGAMLQAYALQKTIDKLGGEASIIDYCREKRPAKTGWKSPSQIVNNIYYTIYNKELNTGYDRYEDFIKNGYNRVIKYANYTELQQNPPQSDIFITGSDQVWNPNNIDEASFLRFAPKDKVTASYAASMGIPYMPAGAKRLFTEYLENIDYISVRESDAKKIIESETDRNAQVNIDPVFLLSKAEWTEMSVKPKLNKPYILCYILYRPSWLNNWLKKLHKQTGKDIVVISSLAYRNVYHTKMIRDAGPREMIGLVQNADFVVSSSFHGTALSIVNQKPFYAVVNQDMPSRISNMLDIYGLSDRIINQNSPTVLNNIDYKDIENIRLQQRQKSIDYLNFLLSIPEKRQVKATTNRNVTLKGTVALMGDKCTACKVCQNVCPVGAISYKPADDGFEYPVINNDICISCSKCLKKCHLTTQMSNTKDNCRTYFGWHKDAEIRRLSSSGGLFSAISEFVLAQNGVVVGAYFDKDTKKVIHASSDDVDFKKFRRSKYVESDMKNAIQSIKTGLDNNRYVLFGGTPCQCAGMREFFGNNPKLILCDFFCHGVPSAKVFKDFLEYKENKKGDQITDYQFRIKNFGWSQHGVSTKYLSGQNHNVAGRCEFFYTTSMLDDMFLRKSCYTCDKNLYHSSDFTLGDFWGIINYDKSLNDDKGISILTVNTDIGDYILSQITDKLQLNKLDKCYLDYAFKIKTSDKKIDKRDRLFNEYNNIGISNFIDKYYKKRLALSNVIFNIKKSKFVSKAKSNNK